MPRKMRPKEVAEYSGFPVAVVMHAAKSEPPRLPGYMTGPFGPYWFDKADVDEWMKSMRTNGRTTEQAREHAAHARKAKRHNKVAEVSA